MIRINLIPYRTARRQQQIMHHVSAFVAVVILAVLLALGAHTMASLQLSDVKEQTIVLQQQNIELKKKIGKIKDLDSLRSNVERKLSIVDRLQEGRFHSLNTFHTIASMIPKNVWLNSVLDKGNDIQLSGLAESNKAVAVFMRKLDQSAIFSNVRLGEINRVVRDGLPLRLFSLTLAREEDKKTEPETSATARKAS
ncbi:MAG: PilN domain-containing protein [Mariprofundus sp.]|nr:PilN domain-containing protein [Mariprofundus sp.]